MIRYRDIAAGFVLGALCVLAVGCSCWIYFTDLVLTDLDTGERSLGFFGLLGHLGVWTAWALGLIGIAGLSLRKHTWSYTIAVTLSLSYLGLFALVLFACWSRPMWRVM